MTYLLVLGSLLFLGVSYGDGLQCYSCSETTPVPCMSGERTCATAAEQCSKTVAKAGDHVGYLAGCAIPEVCNLYAEQIFNGVKNSIETFCCSTDLCNAAPAVRMPLVTAAAMAFAWLAYLL
ncbi:lymphocyte antigen 6 complex locus protein G6d-like [Callorhinchus milii]|uniref:lymphocyte antigen 6 complex locus protein G6d-like n=1 Tax=Callorhinchus milii TaxID=7868 RepID=UPI001C3FEE93|nr:lymphocyte antigen 6 complex locus protein G6d-like [Callorhinchus milii]